MTKQCSKCGVVKDLEDFRPQRTKCRTCCNEEINAKKRADREPEADPKVLRAVEKVRRLARERQVRQGSDFDKLDPLDFEITLDNEYATGISNTPDKALSSQAAQEKRQEFNRKMGEFATDFRDAVSTASNQGGSVGDYLPAKHATYIRDLAEQERRFGNRRWSRSLSIAEAHEQLSRESMMHVAEKYFSAKITPTGYAQLAAPERTKRSVCLLLSDLHLGSELDALDEPMPFTAIAEARRLEFLLRQLCDFKLQYRDHSEAVIILNGDIIEGLLMHDFRSGSPLMEQKAVFWALFREFIAYVAQVFPKVRIVCQPGNHGRDKVRHPGRATSRRWDSHEFEMYWALRCMCSELRNVTWQIDFRGVSIVDLYGSKLGVTHGDAEVKLGHPDGAAKNNAREFDRINSTRLWGVEFDAWVVGHFHTPRFHPGNPKVLYNGALVPPNGFARAMGYVGEPTGQWLFEAVEGYPIGDVRFLEVGPSQDNDERLGTIIKPFRFKD